MLREAGLVADEQLGRRRRYSLVHVRLTHFATWLALFDTRRPGWSRRLDALDTEIHRTRRDRERAQSDRTWHSAPHPTPTTSPRPETPTAPQRPVAAR